MRTTEETRRLTEEMLRLYPAVEAELKRIPGVVSIGVGLKEVAGVLTSELVWRVYVQEKKRPAEVPAGEMIPDEIKGFKTDVILKQDTVPAADEDKYRPIRGGIQIGNGTGSVGTLGCLATLQDGTGDWVALSNHHVMLASGKQVGDRIGQSDISGCCCCTCGEIGTILAAHIGGLTDCAISSIDAGINHRHEIQGIGSVTGWGGVLPGATVRKRGRTTGLTTGTVSDVNYNTTSTAGNSFNNQLLIAPIAGITDMVLPGDSGSAVVDDTVQVVGLIWGQNGHNGVASQIIFVRTEMNIDIPGSGGDVEAFAVRERTRTVSRVEALRQQFTDSQAYAVFERHQPEILHLINHSRPVMMTWQRKQGPAFAAAFYRSLKEPNYRIPLQINGIRTETLLWSMAAALEEHGSERLRQTLIQYAPAVIQAAAQEPTRADRFLETLSALLVPQAAFVTS